MAGIVFEVLRGIPEKGRDRGLSKAEWAAVPPCSGNPRTEETTCKLGFEGERYHLMYFTCGELKEYEFDGYELAALGAEKIAEPSRKGGNGVF